MHNVVYVADKINFIFGIRQNMGRASKPAKFLLE